MAKSADAFRTISEVADWLETPAHVLRFWESKFSQVKPVKRAGGRRYYRPSDMLLLGGIKKLLHHDGMTIKGVQKLLREQGIKHVSGHSQPLDDVTVAEAGGAPIEAEATPVASAPENTVVSFKREPERPDEPEPPVEAESAPEPELPNIDPPAPEPVEPAPIEPEPSEPDTSHEVAAQSDEPPAPAPSEPQEALAAAEEAPADAPEEAPVMPSFMRRTAPDDEGAEPPAPESPASESPAPDSPIEESPIAESPAPEPPAEAPPAPKPNAVDVPADPADDIGAEPGILRQVAALTAPVSPDMANRLRAVLDRLRQTDGANDEHIDS